MELSSRFAGVTLREHRVATDWRQTTNYAAAIGDANPRYLDDTRPGGLAAPPMLAVALTWPMARDLAGRIEAPDFPADVQNTQVHYSEMIRFHRLIRPGDQLTILGRIEAILPHRAGTHCVARYDARLESGEPVFTEWSGAMLRGVRCLEEGGRDLGVPEIPKSPETETAQWESVIRVDPLLPYVYDGCTEIVFPIHTSPAFARMVGLPGIILQGTCTLALAVTELVNREAGGDPERLRTVACRFSGLVLPGTDVRVRLMAREGLGRFFEVLNDRGDRTIRAGYAEIAD